MDIIAWFKNLISWLKINLGFEPAWKAPFNQGRAAVKKGDFAQAIADFTKAIELGKNAFGPRGAAYLRIANYDSAYADLTEALRRNPNIAAYYSARALISYLRNNLPSALVDMDEAIRLEPKVGRHYGRRGLLHLAKDDYTESLADLHEAIRLDDKDTSAHHGLARILAACPVDHHRNGEKAVHHALKAVELGKEKQWCHFYFNTLAAAYAEAGNFEEAIRWANKFLDSNPPEKIAERGRQQLSLYEQGKPYRGEKGMSPETRDLFKKVAADTLAGTFHSRETNQ